MTAIIPEDIIPKNNLEFHSASIDILLATVIAVETEFNNLKSDLMFRNVKNFLKETEDSGLNIKPVPIWMPSNNKGNKFMPPVLDAGDEWGDTNSKEVLFIYLNQLHHAICKSYHALKKIKNPKAQNDMALKCLRLFNNREIFTARENYENILMYGN